MGYSALYKNHPTCQIALYYLTDGVKFLNRIMLWFYVLLSHNLNHHPGTQLKTTLKQQALCHGLEFPQGIGIL